MDGWKGVWEWKLRVLTTVVAQSKTVEWGVYGENVYLDEKTFVWWKKNVCFMGEDLLSCGRTVVCMRRTHLGEGGIKKKHLFSRRRRSTCLVPGKWIQSTNYIVVKRINNCTIVMWLCTHISVMYLCATHISHYRYHWRNFINSFHSTDASQTHGNISKKWKWIQGYTYEAERIHNMNELNIQSKRSKWAICKLKVAKVLVKKVRSISIRQIPSWS